MEKIKLDIQKFAQTLLNNKKSTASSPYCYYTVECTSIGNRTASTVDVTIKVTSHLASSSSYFGTGSTYGLTGTIYFNGVTKTLSLKSTSTSWSGTGNHTASKTFTVDCPAASTSLTGIYFKVDRTGSKAGTSDTSAGCWLAKTSCSNITGIAQYATTPVFTVNPSISNIAETTATLNLGTATATGEVRYQYQIDGGSWSGDVTTAQSLSKLTPNQSHSYSVKAINKINSSMTTTASSTFSTKPYPSVTTEAPDSITLDASTKKFTLTFNNPLGRVITITAKVGTHSILSNGVASITTTGNSYTITIPSDSVYSWYTSGTSCTLTTTAKTADNQLNYSKNTTLNFNENYARPSIDISKMKWQAIHINDTSNNRNYSVLTTTSMITNGSRLQIKRESGLAAGNKSATISSYQFSFNNIAFANIPTSWGNYNGTNTYDLTGTRIGTVKVTDSRGYTNTATINIPFVSYSNPTLTITAARDGYSTNVIFTFSPSYSLAAYGNRLQTAYLDTNSSPTTTRTLTNNKVTIKDIALDSSPVYYAKITDIVGGTSSVVSVTVPKAEPIFFIDATNLGVGVNGLTQGKGLYVGEKICLEKASFSTSAGLPVHSGIGVDSSKLWQNAISFRGPGNDGGWIKFDESTTNTGYLEIATGDDGTEPIHIRQYNTNNEIVRTATLLNGSGNTSFPGTLTASSWAGNLSVSGNISAPSGSLYVGTDGNTTAERQVSCRSGAGTLYLFSQASTTGTRGLYVPKHGTGNAKTIIEIDTNNNATFYGNASTATSATSANSASTATTATTANKLSSTSSSLYYANNETLSFTQDAVFSGLITSSKTKCFFNIVTPKRMDNINTITMQNFEVEARGTSGYLNSADGYIEYVGKSGYTFSCVKVTPNVIGVSLTKSSDWTNVNNNTPVVFKGKCVVKFTT